MGFHPPPLSYIRFKILEKQMMEFYFFGKKLMVFLENITTIALFYRVGKNVGT